MDEADRLWPLVIPSAIACVLFGWAACVVVRDGVREIREEAKHNYLDLLDGTFLFYLVFIRLGGAILLTVFAVMAGYAAHYNVPR